MLLLPASILLNSTQRQSLKTLWPNLTETEQMDFKDLLATNEADLKQILIDLATTDETFLPRFKQLRQKRKRQILSQIEQNQSKTKDQEVENMINKLS